MSRNVRDHEIDCVAIMEKIKIVAADMRGRNADSREFRVRRAKRRVRQKRELDMLRYLQLASTLVGLAPLGDVGVNADIMRDVAAFIEDWRNQQFVPEWRASLSIVPQRYFAISPRRDRFADLPQTREIGFRTSQEAHAFAEQFFARVAGHAAERRVYVDIGISRRPSVTDRYADMNGSIARSRRRRASSKALRAVIS